MTELDCRNELVLRERRGELSPAEHTALDAHLLACEGCRLTRLLGRDFDESATLEAGDGERIAVLAAGAGRFAAERAALPLAAGSDLRAPADAGRPRRVRAPRWRGRALAFAAAFTLLVAAGASAGISVYRARTNAVTDVVAKAPAALAAVQPAKNAVANAAVTEPRPEPTTASEAKPAAPRRALVVNTPADSAALRFDQANRARREGDVARATQLYRGLTRDFPASSEASLAELRLGSLLLEGRNASLALEQFERHLRRSGALVPEALYGRGRALSALGSRVAERRTWLRMVQDYPGSPYTAHAKRRLSELGDGKANPE